MKIIVTGASGYVGGVILRHLRKQGHEVMAWSRRECEAPWRKYQLGNPVDCGIWDGCDALIHAAHDFSTRNWDEELHLNANPSIHLLQSAKASGVARILYISSMSSWDGSPSLYGRSKRLVETTCAGLGITVVRPGLVWGPHAGGMLGRIRSVVQRFPVIPMPWSSSGLRQFLLHEDDLAALVSHVMASGASCHGVSYDACHHAPVPFASLVRAVISAEGRRAWLLPLPIRWMDIGLRIVEKSGIRLPFRSDNLAGLLHTRAPRLESLPETWKPRPFLG